MRGRGRWRLVRLLREVTEGVVAPNTPITLDDRSHPDWTIARANHIMHIDKSDLASAAALAALPPLSASWKATLGDRIEKGVEPNARRRLEGRD